MNLGPFPLFDDRMNLLNVIYLSEYQYQIMTTTGFVTLPTMKHIEPFDFQNGSATTTEVIENVTILPLTIRLDNGKLVAHKFLQVVPDLSAANANKLRSALTGGQKYALSRLTDRTRESVLELLGSEE